MNGLRLVFSTLFLFGLFVSEAHATAACSGENRRDPIRVSLNFEVADPYILQDQEFKQINEESEATRSKWLEDNGLKEVWTTKDLDTLGYAMGGMASNYIISAHARSRAYRTYYCAYYKRIEINIMYRTLIRIPKEIPKGSCVYNVILAHELRHDKANSDSFHRYMLQLQKDLPKMAEFYERTPIEPGALESRYKVMQASIKDAIELYIKEYVYPASAKINKEIDSPESYKAEAEKIRACLKRR